jgi:hypothetical protein
MSTQSPWPLPTTNQWIRIKSEYAGLKELFDFIFENLADSRGYEEPPHGQSQGVITAGSLTFSLLDGVAKFQEIEVRPVIEKAIDLVIHERQGRYGQRWAAISTPVTGNSNSIRCGALVPLNRPRLS